MCLYLCICAPDTISVELCLTYAHHTHYSAVLLQPLERRFQRSELQQKRFQMAVDHLQIKTHPSTTIFSEEHMNSPGVSYHYCYYYLLNTKPCFVLYI